MNRDHLKRTISHSFTLQLLEGPVLNSFKILSYLLSATDPSTLGVDFFIPPVLWSAASTTY